MARNCAQDLNDKSSIATDYLGDDQGEKAGHITAPQTPTTMASKFVMADGSAFQVSITPSRKAPEAMPMTPVHFTFDTMTPRRLCGLRYGGTNSWPVVAVTPTTRTADRMARTTVTMT